MKKIVFVLFLTLLSCSIKKYTLRNAFNGIVFNDKNNVVQDVEVKFIENENLFTTKPVKSNSKGIFFLEGIKTDNYKQFGMLGPEIPSKIVFSKLGYRNDTIDIKQFNKELNRSIYDTINIGNIYLKQ